MYNTKDLHNELSKLFTEQELKLIIGICKFIIETLESCIFVKNLDQMQEEEEE